MNTRETILGINPCTYGLNYHDPSIVIISDGKIIFGIEEERVNRIKGSKGKFPTEAIKYALNYCGLNWGDITSVAIGFSPELWQERLTLELQSIIKEGVKNACEKDIVVCDAKKIMTRMLASNLTNRFNFFNDITNVNSLIYDKCACDKMPKIQYYEHHLSHAASSYEVSKFDDAVCIVVDGIGEVAATSIWIVKNHKYEKLIQIDYPNSLGYFYSIATKFLGFTPWEHEGKTMALAAYGKKDLELVNRLSKIIQIKDGIYDVADFILRNASNYLMVDEEKALKDLEKIMGFNRRRDTDDFTEKQINFAWAVQDILEKSILGLVDFAVKKTGVTNVCVSGGIFMNCKMNMVVREYSIAKNYFVQPLAGDLGLSLGAALLSSSRRFQDEYVGVDFGPEFTNDDIERDLKKNGIIYTKSYNIANDVASLISEGKIVCWFNGRMEMGARALGSRSILADPRDASIADKINSLVKHRELWRPFACSVLEEYASSIFENCSNKRYPFMIEAFKVRENWQNKIPAVIHKADMTSRPQTVNKMFKPKYYEMISAFNEITGCPLVLNTSFNDKGQPIILSPEMAIHFFEKNPVDALAIGDFLIKREENKHIYENT